MTAMLNLLVLRAEKPSALVPFYEALGISFKLERHGKGLEHYSGLCGETLLEIYPATDEENTIATRLGFLIDDIVPACREAGSLGSILEEPSETPWGIRAVLADPAGHRVELTERS